MEYDRNIFSTNGGHTIFNIRNIFSAVSDSLGDVLSGEFFSFSHNQR